jgi:hypothetical protein
MATQFCELHQWLASVFWCLWLLSSMMWRTECVCVYAMFDAVHLYSCWRMSAHPRLLTKRFSKQYVKYIFAGQMVSLCIMHAVVCTKVGVFSHLARACSKLQKFVQVQSLLGSIAVI